MRWQSHVWGSDVLFATTVLFVELHEPVARRWVHLAPAPGPVSAAVHAALPADTLNNLSEGAWLTARRRQRLVLDDRDAADGDWLSARRRRAPS